MDTQRILYLSYDGMTDPLGQSQVLPYLVGLSEKGYRFTLISCEKKDRLIRHRETIQSICKASNIDWQPINYTKRPPVLSTLYDLGKMKRLAYQLYRSIAFDIIHCRSYLSALIGLEMKKEYGVKFVFDMRGFWADERLDGNIWNLENPMHKRIYQYFKKKEIEFFTNADYCVSLTEAGKKEIHRWDLPSQPVPIKVIPCCTDLKLFDYQAISIESIENLRNHLGIGTDSFVLVYLGSIGTWYCLKEMLLFFRQFLNHNEKAKLLFVTQDNANIIRKEAKKLNIPEETLIIIPVQRKEVPLYLSLADCGLFFIKPKYSKIASSPTKQGEMIAMGLPIICNDIGDTGNIVEKHNIGVSVKSFSEKSFARGIDALPILVSKSKEVYRLVAEELFSLEKGVNKYEELYRKILGSETKML